jgi:hypothetical protein
VQPRAAVIPLVAFFDLMHLWTSLFSFVFGGARSRDQSGIDDRSMLHGHAPLHGGSLERFKNLAAEVMLLKQVPEAKNHYRIRDPIADQVDS